ncbi:MAG: hypothetical protein J6D27_10205 [Ruminiclostridium sp.]|nr:hypothetical protein [Ruminiclostridium sp.]
MNENKCTFNELEFFAHIKKRPGMYFGEPSLFFMRNYILGMQHAFSFCGYQDKFKYFHLFTEWYQENVINDERGYQNGYANWYTHLMYVTACHDKEALERFLREFERYLEEVHNISLPEVN